MNTILSFFINLYKNHTELTLVLVSSILSIIGTVFIKQIGFWIRSALVKLGSIIGGNFSYKNYLDKYLNWMVLEYQDLNLTGIIGSGPKPKLEQVFIGLSIVQDYDIDEGRESKTRKITRLWTKIWSRRTSEPTTTSNAEALTSPSETQLPTPNQLTKTFLPPRERTDTVLILIIIAAIIGIFAILPFYVLFLKHHTTVLGTMIVGLLPGLTLSLLSIWSLSEIRDGDIELILTVGFILLIYIGIGAILAFLFGFPSSSALFGIAIGFLLGLLLTKFIDTNINTNSQSDIDFVNQIRNLLKHDTIAILGKPGAGKSTFIQFLALTLSREKAGESALRQRGIVRRKLGLRRWYIPILIPLRKVAKIIKEGSPKTNLNLLLIGWRDIVLPSDLRVQFPEKYLVRMLRRKRCILLLDGLDEVANDEEFRATIQEIRGLAAKYPGNKLIITSRFSGWRGGVGSLFREFQIEDLNNEQVKNFVKDWYRAIEENRSTAGVEKESSAEKEYRLLKSRERANNLNTALSEVKPIRRLAENPLLLSIICFIHYHKTLPRERLSLYQDCSDLVLLQWDQEKGLLVDDTELSLKRKEAIMQELAFAFHTQQIGSEYGGKEATSKEIIAIIEKQLRTFRFPINKATTLFEKLINRSGILVVVERFSDRYAFSHLTFQEFYTAKYIFENQLDLLERFSGESIDSLAGWWKEVLFLYVSMVPDSSTIIQRIIQAGDSELDIASRRLQLAAQCLEQAIAVHDETLHDNILKRLLNIRLSTPPLRDISASSFKVLRSYLLQLASHSASFFDYSIKTTIESTPHDELIKFIPALIKLGQSSDGSLVTAAIHGLIQVEVLTDTHELVTAEDLLTFLDHPLESVKVAALKYLLLREDLLENTLVLEKVLTELRSLPLADTEDYRPQTYRTQSSLRLLFELEQHLTDQICTVRFTDESIRCFIAHKIWSYASEDAKIRGVLVHRGNAQLIATIILLSPKSKQGEYINWFLSLLKKGKIHEREFAIRVITYLRKGGIDLVDLNVADILIDILKTSNLRITSAVLNALADVQLTLPQRERLIQHLTLKLHLAVRSSLIPGWIAIQIQGKVFQKNSIRFWKAVLRAISNPYPEPTSLVMYEVVPPVMYQPSIQIPAIFKTLIHLGVLSHQDLAKAILADHLTAAELSGATWLLKKCLNDNEIIDDETALLIINRIHSTLPQFREISKGKQRVDHLFKVDYPLQRVVAIAENLNIERQQQVCNMILHLLENSLNKFEAFSIISLLEQIAYLGIDWASIPQAIKDWLDSQIESKHWNLVDRSFTLAFKWGEKHNKSLP